MKKVFSLMLLLATMLTFTACSRDEPEMLKVSFKENTITLQYGESYTLHPIVESGDIDFSKAIWSSSNDRVATVSEEGVVVGHLIFDNDFSYGEGEAVISLLYDNSVLATCKVVVTPWKATAINLNRDKLDMVVGESELLKVTTHANGNNTGVGLVTKLNWESSDRNVATVSDNGEVVAVSDGNAVITVTDTESGLSDKCEVSVKSRAVTGVSCPENVKIMVGDCVQIKATIVPDDATNKAVVWASSNPLVATVDNEGNVCGIALGETIVIAKTADGGFEAKCNVKVVDLPDMVTAHAGHGCTVSNYTSFNLSLVFETNTDIPVYINSVILTDKNGTIINIAHPNKYYTYFYYTYTTHSIYTPNGISGDAINAELAKINGWKILVQYTWSNNEYTIECINQ